MTTVQAFIQLSASVDDFTRGLRKASRAFRDFSIAIAYAAPHKRTVFGWLYTSGVCSDVQYVIRAARLEWRPQ